MGASGTHLLGPRCRILVRNRSCPGITASGTASLGRDRSGRRPLLCSPPVPPQTRLSDLFFLHPDSKRPRSVYRSNYRERLRVHGYRSLLPVLGRGQRHTSSPGKSTRGVGANHHARRSKGPRLRGAEAHGRRAPVCTRLWIARRTGSAPAPAPTRGAKTHGLAGTESAKGAKAHRRPPASLPARPRGAKAHRCPGSRRTPIRASLPGGKGTPASPSLAGLPPSFRVAARLLANRA